MVVARESGTWNQIGRIQTPLVFGGRICARLHERLPTALLAVDNVPDETTLSSLPRTGTDTAALYFLTASAPFLSFTQL